MAHKVNWSAEAEQSYIQILDYLTQSWSSNEVEDFITRTENLLKVIADFPNAFKASSYRNIRKSVLGKHNSLFYLVKDSEIYLLYFWDNRMNPVKNKYEIEQ